MTQSHIHVVHNNRPYDHDRNQTEYYAVTIEGKECIDAFKILIQRALNCWPDAHPALKEMGDMFMHGKVLQDYYHTRTDKWGGKSSN